MLSVTIVIAIGHEVHLIFSYLYYKKKKQCSASVS